MQVITEYIRDSYMTLMLLAGLTAILIANRRTKIDGTQYMWAIMGIAFVITVFEYIEIWCDTYNKPLWILYFKAAVTYSLYPLLMILELFLIAQIKHKLLIMIPYFLELPFIIADLFGTDLVYGYYEDHGFNAGVLHILPALVLCFYTVLLFVYSIKFIEQKQYSKAMIAVFVSVSAIVTTFLEYNGTVTGHTTERAALEILIYYFYLAAIYQSQMQAELNEKKTQLMISQIQPHFIRNSLSVIRSLCYDEPERAVDVIDEFSKYLDRVMKLSTDIELVSLRKEIEFVDNYLLIEEYGSRIKLNIVKKLDNVSFRVPPLSVQPIVENALKHAFDRKQQERTVIISSFEDEKNFYVTVEDNGKGFDPAVLETLDGNHIGINNVRERLKAGINGALEIDSVIGRGTKVTMTIPRDKGSKEEKE